MSTTSFVRKAFDRNTFGLHKYYKKIYEDPGFLLGRSSQEL